MCLLSEVNAGMSATVEQILSVLVGALHQSTACSVVDKA